MNMVKCITRTLFFGLVAIGTATILSRPVTAQARVAGVSATMQKTGEFVPRMVTGSVKHESVQHDATPREIPFRPVIGNRALNADEFRLLKSRVAAVRPRFKPGIPPHSDPASAPDWGGINPMTPGYLYETNALNAYETGGWYPADDSLAVGVNSAIQPANSAVGIFSRDPSGLYLQFLTDANTFMNFPFTPPFDPRAVYDYQNGHFFISFGSFPFVDANGPHFYVLLAVSKTNDALGTWYTYAIDYVPLNTGVVAADEPVLFDYPDLGMDASNVYITGNIFGNAGGYYGSSILAFDKAALEAGKSKVPMAVFNGLNSTLTPPYVWAQGPSKQSYFVFNQPGVTGPTAGTGYIGLYAVTGSVKSNTIKLSAPYNVVVPYYDVPAAAEQPGFYPLDSLDTRFQDKTTQRGETVYAVNCVSLLSFPMITAYQFNGATAKLAQSINLITSPTSCDFNPSIANNGKGITVINWDSTDISKTVAADNSYENVRSITLGKSWGTKPQAGTLVPFSGSTQPYFLFRNGDYSMTVVDPVYDEYFWGINQNIYDIYDWNSYIFQSSAL